MEPTEDFKTQQIIDPATTPDQPQPTAVPASRWAGTADFYRANK